MRTDDVEDGCLRVAISVGAGQFEVAESFGDARRLLSCGTVIRRPEIDTPIDAHESRACPPNSQCLCSCDVVFTALVNGAAAVNYSGGGAEFAIVHHAHMQ